MAVRRDSSETIKQGKRHLYKMHVYECMGPGKQMGGTTALVVVAKSTVKIQHLQKRELMNSFDLSLVRPYLGYCMQLWASPLSQCKNDIHQRPPWWSGPVGRG